MKIIDKGILSPSTIEVYSPSTFARSALYCITQTGHFYCNSQYGVERRYLNSYLMCYVHSGELYVETCGKSYSADSGDVVFLDCHRPHRYYCKNNTVFSWFHFFGASSEAYAELLYEQRGIIKRISGKVLGKQFDRIIFFATEGIHNEHMVSAEIARLFASLAEPDQRELCRTQISDAIQYIELHYMDPVSMDELARYSNMSLTHFSREFKKYTSYTPHDYLLSYRLRQAKIQLMITDDPIETIAEQCGFNSLSHFARIFREKIGTTPSQFRKIPY